MASANSPSHPARFFAARRRSVFRGPGCGSARLPSARCPPGRKTSAKPGLSLNAATEPAQFDGDDGGDGKALLGVADRRREDLGERELPVLRVELEPAVAGARDAPGVRAVERDRAVGERRDLLGRQRERGAAGGVEADDFLLRRVPEDGEEVAAEAVRRRLHQAEAGVRRDRRVDGAPPLAQDLHSRLSAEGLGARHHAVLGPDGGAGRLSTPSRGPFGEERKRDDEGEECDEGRSHAGIVRGSDRSRKREAVRRPGRASG